MADIVSGIMDFIFSNIIWFVAIGVIGFIAYSFLKIYRTTKLMPLKRSDVERKNMERRLINNPSTVYKWLYKKNVVKQLVDENNNPIKDKNDKPILIEYGENKLIGKISHFRTVSMKGSNLQNFMQMRVQPMLLTKPIRIVNPLGKIKIFQISDNEKIRKSVEEKAIIIPNELEFDYHIGIDYNMDKDTLDGHMNLINNEMLETDYDLMASRYFVKSQEQCVYDPAKAHELAMKEKEIEIELAKRKGKLTTI